MQKIDVFSTVLCIPWKYCNYLEKIEKNLDKLTVALPVPIESENNSTGYLEMLDDVSEDVAVKENGGPTSISRIHGNDSEGQDQSEV